VRHLLFIVCQLFFLLSWAERGSAYVYRQYTISDNLISNNVFHVFRDSKGYLWFCTDKGISRYDGNAFRNYTVLEGLTDNTVFNVSEDSAGRLWVYTFNGQPCFIRNGRVYNRRSDRLLKQMPVLGFMNATFQDSSRVLYFGYQNGHVVMLAGNRQHTLKLADKINAIFRSGNEIAIIAKTEKLLLKNGVAGKKLRIPSNESFVYNGMLFMVHDNGLNVYKDDRLVWKSEGAGLSLRNVVHVYGDGQGNVFCSTNDGLVILNTRTGSERKLFAGLKVSCVGQDAYGHYWVTTFGNGVFCLNGELDGIKLLKDVGNCKVTYARNRQLFYIDDKAVNAVREDRGKAIFQVLPAPFAGPIEPFYIDEDYFFFTLDDRGKSGRRGNLSIYDLKRRSLHSATGYNVKSVYQTGSGVYLFVNILSLHCGTVKNGKLNKFGEVSFKNRIKDSYYDREMNRLFLVSDNKVYEYDPVRHELRACYGADMDEDIVHIHVSGETVFAFTNYNRVHAYNHRTRQKHTFGLGNYAIYHVDRIGTREYVLSTNSGYAALALDNTGWRIASLKKIVAPIPGKDIQSIYGFGSSIICNAYGKLLLFDKELLNRTSGRPYTSIEELVVNGRKYTGQTVELKAASGCNVEMLLNTVYLDRGGVSYQYRIREKDRGNWHVSKNPGISILLKGSGSYQIEVRSVADNGLPSESSLVNIIAHPPFYRSAPFYAILVLLLVLATILGIRLYHRKRKRLMQEELDYLRLEHRAINSLLNPHFVFNTINNIQNLINDASKEQANTYLATMSRMIRQNIENLQYDMVPLSGELELIENYIRLQNLRFGNRIILDIICTLPDTGTIYIPPLLVHTFVENSIVHGFRNDRDHLTIQLNVEQTADDYLVIRIRDDGRGFSGKEAAHTLKNKTSMGIAFNRKRLQRLSEYYKVLLSMDICDLRELGGQGTEVTLVLYAKFGELLQTGH